ncbi:hypothetical protein BDF21DRAFT_492964 [Thamnidium elegans]|uniref:Uncharacterized protein n=1 Tax=Thamnidium elegans TaxID=101142 RepID=A0A8H7SNJ1_9FUNG|nr:hypothetical protein INT48_005158 [Thamnidium elegans]KAI8082185.1 hypothetical protein BDF21DRAFT_492964 [Thamnidium elegans]
MRFLPTIIATGLLVFSVYGDDLTKPKLGEHALSCLLIVNGVTSQFQILKNSIDQFTEDESHSTVSAIYKKEQILEEYIRRSRGCCVTIRPEITDDEVVAASDSLSLLTADVVAALRSIQEKKPLFGNDPVTYARIRSHIGDLDNGIDHLLGCLLFKTPGMYVPLVSGFRETIDEAFNAAKLAFDT